MPAYGLRYPLTHRKIPNMTLAGARVVMQDHIDCLISVCARKAQAKALLVEAKKMVPDASRVRG